MIGNKELLAPERLVRSGREKLYEAVNTGRLVAFVGSGVSLVYGQPTWNAFIKRLKAKLHEAIKEAEDHGDLSAAEAGRMRAMANVTGIGGSDGLITLELIRRAYAQIERDSGGSSGSKRYQADLRSLFTFNAEAQDLLSKRLEEASVPKVESVGDDGKILRAVYDTKTLAALAEIGSNPNLKLLADLLRKEPSRHQVIPEGAVHRDRELPIDRRSSLAIFLAHCAGTHNEIHELLRVAIEEHQPAEVPSRPLLDPLREMDEWLRLRRYVTTNYDLGLEDQHMNARDGRPLTPGDIRRPNIEISDGEHSILCQHRDGRVVRSDVNDGTHVAPLFDFALGGVDNSVHIYHLHGRVDRPETIIAADSEYNRLYRSEGGTRTSFDHAYDALIVGNPILFVGSGMTEAELTRVLRDNVSNPDVLRAAPSIVLREAIKPQHELILDQTQLATRLGVRVVYTGHARRGAAYTLRDHLLLIDYVAYRYRLAGREVPGAGGGKYFGNAPFRYRTENPEFDGVDFANLPEDSNEKVESLLDLIEKRFRLLHDLDYERVVIAWLIAFSPLTPPDIDFSWRDRLIADYLNMLVAKLISAALRHELRQTGHEAIDHYRERSMSIVARRSIVSSETDFLTRHISKVNTLVLPGTTDQTSRSPVYVANLNASSDHLVRPNFTDIDCLSGLLPPNAACERTIVLGARGIGKGRLLADFVRRRQDDRKTGHLPRQLYINCCYGQEIDSIASIVDQFLLSPLPDQSSNDLSRRERTLSTLDNHASSPPLIVLGGVDRIFGTDGIPMSVEFEWLLDQLLHPDRKISLLLIGELRCLDFFRGRIERQRNGPEDTPSPQNRSQQGAANLWVISPKGPKESVGLSAKLGHIAEVAHRPHHDQEDRETRLNMAHGTRKADHLIGDWLETLETGKARLENCEADDQLALEIVKACAFIGLPVEADALVSVPAIQSRLRDHFGKTVPTDQAAAASRAKDEAKHIRDALARALQLGLVNVVEPFGKAEETELPDEWSEQSSNRTWASCLCIANWVIEHGNRLVVHRLTAQVLKDRFGVPNNAGVLSDSYNLSLYALQPDDASVPEPRVTGELEDLIDHLMNAWKETDLWIKPGNGDHTEIDLRHLFRKTRGKLTDNYADDLSLHYLESLRDMRRRLSFASPLPVMGLRAAGGVIRGYYSAVNLFGLDLGDQGRAGRKISAISDHKQRIRLLLNLTIEAQKWGKYGNNGEQPLFDFLKSSLDSVAGIVTVDSGDGHEGKLQTLKKDENISLLCNADDVPSLWHRSRPQAVNTFHSAVTDADGSTLRVTGLRKRLNLPEPDFQKLTPIHPFFDGEIVWLLNERAMLAMAQGDLYTASTTFELAFEANRKIERDRYHPNRARLTVNRAFLWIERGRIADARRELETLLQHLDDGDNAIGSGTNEGRLIAALCDGYLGLCSHLSGILTDAEAFYDRAIAAFAAMREQRPIAIFEHHRCALLRQIPGRETDAEAALQRGIAAATGGRHTDILYRLRIAKAHHEFFASKSSASEVIATLNRAIEYGLSLEMHRVAVEALTARAQVHLKFGDLEAASRDVSRAAAKAAQHGMTLRRIWLRVMTGQVYRLRDDPRNARMILERAVSEGSHIGYQRAVEVATRQLINLKMR